MLRQQIEKATMSHRKRGVLTTVAGAAALLAVAMVLAGATSKDVAKTKAASESPDVQMMVRLSGDQYRNTIADVFGPDFTVAGRFDPEMRISGLLAIGSGEASISPSGAEQYLKMARSIAAEAVDEQHRDKLAPCKPKDLKKADDACARQILAKYGRLLFRRPLTADELKGQLAVVRKATTSLSDFYAGVDYGLVAQLTAPEFLFIQGVRDHGDGRYLDDYGKAARLSYFLWNTTPDDELLTAAERGELSTPGGRSRQAERLLASPRLEGGVRAFFSDFLDLRLADDTAKDPIIYPQFVAGIIPDAKEETLRTVVDHILVQKADYRDLFTTQKTFLTRRLGSLYRVPVRSDAWTPYEFPAGTERAGILTQISFVATHSHPGRSSPTLRGKAVRELVLCQKVPPPPPNVDFSAFESADPKMFKTTRARLDRHRTDPVCAGCHRVTDPVGLALENFDSAGSFRTQENGERIDTSGSLDGANYSDVAGLGKAMHDNPAATSCVVQRVYGYALRRKLQPSEQPDIDALTKRFAGDGYRFDKLLASVATSDAFYRVAPLGE